MSEQYPPNARGLAMHHPQRIGHEHHAQGVAMNMPMSGSAGSSMGVTMRMAMGHMGGGMAGSHVGGSVMSVGTGMRVSATAGAVGRPGTTMKGQEVGVSVGTSTKQGSKIPTLHNLGVYGKITNVQDFADILLRNDKSSEQ